MAKAFASAADTQEQIPEIVELGKDVYGYVSDFDPNCGFIVGDDAVLAVDTRATPSLARSFQEDIRKVTDKPVKYIFLTHYHAVRVMGAAAFTDVDAIFCSSRTKHMIETHGEADFASEVSRFPRLFKGVEEVPGLTRPRFTFDTEMSMWFGGREIQFKWLGRGHTAGDSVCWVPDAKVLFSGDLVENKAAVYTGDAYMTEWPDTLERVKALKPEVMVPGRGAVLRGEKEVNGAIDATKSFVTSVLEGVRAGLKDGKSRKEIYRDVRKAMDPKFGDWPVYEHCMPFDVTRAMEELSGTEHPTVWTDERDAALWKELEG